MSVFQASRELKQTLPCGSLLHPEVIIDHFMNLAKSKYILYHPGVLSMAGVGVQP